MFKKILFPTDNSEEAEKALSYVINIAGKFNSEVIIFYSNDLPENLIRKLYGKNQTYDEIKNDILLSYQGILNEIKDELVEKGIRTKVLIGNGKAGSSIIEAAFSEDCELVIIGSRGFGAAKSFLLGSVTNYVLHHIKCPILIIDGSLPLPG